MLIMTTLLSFSVRTSTDSDIISAPKAKEKAKLTFIPADKNAPEAAATAAGTETYTVKSGDTLQGIVIRFYGSYSPAKAEKLRQVNNMDNPNALKLGQVLTIPVIQ